MLNEPFGLGDVQPLTRASWSEFGYSSTFEPL